MNPIMSKKPASIKPKFEVGDRVAERPKQNAIAAIRKESREIVAKYTTQRRGVVVGNTVRTLSGRAGYTSRACYVSILWDGLKTPSEHSQMRICLESEYDQLREEYYAITE